MNNTEEKREKKSKVDIDACSRLWNITNAKLTILGLGELSQPEELDSSSTETALRLYFFLRGKQKTKWKTFFRFQLKWQNKKKLNGDNRKSKVAKSEVGSN